MYSEPHVTRWYIQNKRHIQNPGVFKSLAYSELEAHSEPCQRSSMDYFAKIVNNYNYLCKL